ncbi:hypothetical protein HYQ46_007898 [Verticillium longisporum]|nr:hypothetical protein HYQ46_007898 [Verticillium longisporum]
MPWANSSTSTLRVVNSVYGYGNQAVLLSLKFLRKMARLAASMRRSSCSFIISPNCATSSGNDSHSMVGMMLMAEAKKYMMRRSRRTVRSTLGCTTLTAT